MMTAEQFIEERLVPPLLHGDEQHQEWLRAELRKWIPDLAAQLAEKEELRGDLKVSEEDRLEFDKMQQEARAETEALRAQLGEKEREIARLKQGNTMLLEAFAERTQRLQEAQASLTDKRRLARRLDIIWNGVVGAAIQASLCDIVSQIERELPALRQREAELEQARTPIPQWKAQAAMRKSKQRSTS